MEERGESCLILALLFVYWCRISVERIRPSNLKSRLQG